MDLPLWARVGAKVVCIDDSAARWPGARWGGDDQPPVVGKTYTIAKVFIDLGMGEPAVHLVELQRGYTARLLFGDDAGYGLFRFRPLVDQQTDIATHFAHHLKQPEKV